MFSVKIERWRIRAILLCTFKTPPRPRHLTLSAPCLASAILGTANDIKAAKAVKDESRKGSASLQISTLDGYFVELLRLSPVRVALRQVPEAGGDTVGCYACMTIKDHCHQEGSWQDEDDHGSGLQLAFGT